MAEPKEGKVTDKASDIARNIWLAGLGAYGKAFDEAHDRYEKVSKDTSRVFDELVAKGRKLEEMTTSKLSHVRSGTLSLEERLARVRNSLGFGHPGNEDLMKRIDQIEAKLDLIMEALGVGQKQAAPTASEAANES